MIIEFLSNFYIKRDEVSFINNVANVRRKNVDWKLSGIELQGLVWVCVSVTIDLCCEFLMTVEKQTYSKKVPG